jgi:hypothetical protein
MTDNERLRKWLDAAVELAYRAGAEQERAAVVAYLRGQAEMTYNNTNAYHALWLAAEAVEHGKHRREEEP